MFEIANDQPVNPISFAKDFAILTLPQPTATTEAPMVRCIQSLRVAKWGFKVLGRRHSWSRTQWLHNWQGINPPSNKRPTKRTTRRNKNHPLLFYSGWVNLTKERWRSSKVARYERTQSGAGRGVQWGWGCRAQQWCCLAAAQSRPWALHMSLNQ